MATVCYKKKKNMAPSHSVCCGDTMTFFLLASATQSESGFKKKKKIPPVLLNP